MNRTFLLATAICLAATPAPAAATPVSCASLISGYIGWMRTGPTYRRIGAKFARVKITSFAIAPSTTRWGHISEAEGAFAWHGTDMQGRFMVAFSDRGFNIAHRDITDITLRADGSGNIILRSWGDTLIPLSDLRCDSGGFLQAAEREGNGTSFITLSFRRETYGQATPDMKD